MWSRAVSSVAALASSGCATEHGAVFEARPTAATAYAVSLSTHGIDEERHNAELARCAKATCGGPYALTTERELVQVCTDGCNRELTTIVTLSCEKKSA
jgi:hypothetical protein